MRQWCFSPVQVFRSFGSREFLELLLWLRLCICFEVVSGLLSVSVSEFQLPQIQC